MTPFIGNKDFSGGLNTRELGHNIALNEATLAEGIDIRFSSVRTLDGDIRGQIDEVKYPEVGGIAGTAGGTPNDEPIIGAWRYYHDTGFSHNARVRVHGAVVEFWANGPDDAAEPEYRVWTTIGAAWPVTAVPTAVTFENTIYILHGDPAIGYTAKYLFWSGAAWLSGDVPIPVAPLAALRPAFAVNYRNRLYAVDTANEPFTLRYSGVNLPEVWNAPGGGYVTLGDASGDPITGLFVHRDVLLIFRRASVWRYWVDEYGWEHIGRIHGAAGCLVHRSICAYKDAVFYASDEGLTSIYGADSDCVTHKIESEIEPHPDYIQYLQAIVHAKTGTLWVTYLHEFTTKGTTDECGDPILDECGDPVLHNIYETDVWKADIRRPNIIKPRWVKLPYYRLTSFDMPPQSNVYKGSDTQALHFCAQQPDMTEWNGDPSAADELYLDYQPVDLGGPRHWNYRYGTGFDRDQVPAYHDECLDPLYAGDVGIGYWLRFRTPRYLPVGNMRDVSFGDMRLDYFIRKAQAAGGLDAGYSRIWIDDTILTPANPEFPLDDTLWPFSDVTPAVVIDGVGAKAHQEYRLSNQNPSSGMTLMMDWTIIGYAARTRRSWRVEFGYWSCEYDVSTDKLNPED